MFLNKWVLTLIVFNTKNKKKSLNQYKNISKKNQPKNSLYIKYKSKLCQFLKKPKTNIK